MLERYGKRTVSHQAGNCTQRRQNYCLHCVSLGTKKKKVFCFSANPVTNMLWFKFKSILIFLPCGGFSFSFWSLNKGNEFYFFLNLDSCSNHSNDLNHSITSSPDSEYLKLYPDFRSQVLSVLAASIFFSAKGLVPKHSVVVQGLLYAEHFQDKHFGFCCLHSACCIFSLFTIPAHLNPDGLNGREDRHQIADAWPIQHTPLAFRTAQSFFTGTLRCIQICLGICPALHNIKQRTSCLRQQIVSSIIFLKLS